MQIASPSYETATQNVNIRVKPEEKEHTHYLDGSGVSRGDSMNGLEETSWSRLPFLVMNPEGKDAILLSFEETGLIVSLCGDHERGRDGALEGGPLDCQAFWALEGLDRSSRSRSLHLVVLNGFTLKWYTLFPGESRIRLELRQTVHTHGRVSEMPMLEWWYPEAPQRNGGPLIPVYRPSTQQWELIRFRETRFETEVLGKHPAPVGRLRLCQLLMLGRGRYHSLIVLDGGDGGEIWSQEVTPSMAETPVRVAGNVSRLAVPGAGIDGGGTLHLVWFERSAGATAQGRAEPSLKVWHRRKAPGPWSRGEWREPSLVATLSEPPGNVRPGPMPVLIENGGRLWLIFAWGGRLEVYSSADRGQRWVRDEKPFPDLTGIPEPVRLLIREEGRGCLFGSSLFRREPFWVLTAGELGAGRQHCDASPESGDDAGEGRKNNEGERPAGGDLVDRLRDIERHLQSLVLEVSALEKSREELSAQLVERSKRTAAAEYQLAATRNRVESLKGRLEEVTKERDYYESRVRDLEKSLEAERILFKRLRMGNGEGTETESPGCGLGLRGILRRVFSGKRNHSSQNG